MKILFIAFLFGISSLSAQAQNNIAGTYEQDAFIAPDNLKDGENNLVIEKDLKSSKKIWIRNLIEGSKVYAIYFSKMDENIVYKIPSQTIKGYTIKMGCIMYNTDEESLSLSINNKGNCFGMSQSDYDNPVSVGKNGKVKAGGVSVDKKGSVKAGGVKIDNGNVEVDAKGAMAGIQYMGHKGESKSKTDENDD